MLLKGFAQDLPHKAFDYIIVGAGGAGSALFSSLLQRNPTARVALVEAGAANDTSDDLSSKVPLLSMFPHQCARRTPAGGVATYQVQHHDSSVRGGECYTRRRGIGLGGSSTRAENAYLRGTKEDYDMWGKLFPGWRYEDVLPVFTELESNARLKGTMDEEGKRKLHGEGGPLIVRDPPPLVLVEELNRSFAEVCNALGLPLKQDFNDGQNFGYGALQFVQELNGKKMNVFDSLVRNTPLATVGCRSGTSSTPGSVVMFQTKCHKLLLDERLKVTGIQLVASDSSSSRGQSPLELTAEKEVILCAGNYETPLLLQRSGIGPEKVLSGVADVPVKLAQEDVGMNIIEGTSIATCCECTGRRGDGGKSLSLGRVPYLYRQWQKFKQEGTGIFASPYEFCAFVNLSGAPISNFKVDFLTMPYLHEGQPLQWYPGYTTRVTNMYPLSRGSIHLGGPLGSSKGPIFQGNWLKNPADLDTMMEGMAWSNLMTDPDAGLPSSSGEDAAGTRHSPFHFLHGAQRSFPKGLPSKEKDIKQFIAEHIEPGSESWGSCAMGCVVDEELKVAGLQGLRIAGSPVVPVPVSGTSIAVSTMIGRKCSTLLS